VIPQPILNGTVVVVPMIAFAFHERRIGHTRCCAGWVPACGLVVLLDNHGNKLAVPLPAVSVLDTIDVYEMGENRRKCWTRLIEELSAESDRAKRLFERDQPEQLNSLLRVEIEFLSIADAYAAVLRGESVPPPSVLDSCDLSEQCLGTLVMLALERAAG
jgi:hypothetical protein